MPFNLFCGVFIPLELLPWRELPDLAKLTFGVVTRQIGDNCGGVLYLDDIAAELAVSTDTASRATRCLEDAGLLRHCRTGRGSKYFCVWHPRLARSLLTTQAALEALSPGDPYSPWKKFMFVIVPNSLVAWRSLNCGAKLLFGLTAFHARGGRCFAADHTLAKEMGRGTPQLRRLRRELELAGLISYDPTRSNDKYRFLFHPILNSSLRRRGDLGAESQFDSAESQADSAPDPAFRGGANKEEETGRDLYRQNETDEIVRPSETDEEFVRRHLLVFQPRIQEPLDNDPEIISTLLGRTRHLGLSVYRLGSVLYRVWQQTQRRNPPKIDHWSWVVDEACELMAGLLGNR